MGLFFLSLILTVLTGYFITSIFEQKNFIKIFIYMCTIMFASVVLNVEILSLLNSISQVGILIINSIFAIVSGFIWYKKGKPAYKFRPKRFFKKLYYAVMSDKYLLVLGLAFLFMISVSSFIIAIMPVVNADAGAYHVLRSVFWISNKNLNHFVTADIRNLVMPINSEILYLWLFVFLKKQLWLGIFSFVGFILSIFSIYGILGRIGFSERHKLWTIFITSAFPSVIILLSGTETDIIISGLVLSSIYLFWEYLDKKRLSDLFISSLSYALAIGTKTPALMLMFPVGLWMLWMSVKSDKQNYYKIILSFLGFGFINFIIFSSYNYILNFLDFGNIFGPKGFLQVHNNFYGIKGAFANFIKHIFLFFDFTGLSWNKIFGSYIVKARTLILTALHLSSIPDGYLTSDADKINNTLFDPLAGLGVMGFLVFLPYWIFSLIKPLFKRDNKTLMICSFGLILLGSIFVMSYKIQFMTYNIRFLTSFCVVAAPILVYSYSRKNSLWKFIITFWALFGLILISTHLWRAPVLRIVSHLQKGYTISQIRQISMCELVLKKSPQESYNLINDTQCMLRSLIMSQPKNSNILYFQNQYESLLLIKLLDFYGYNIDYKLLEDANNINFDKYDIIMMRNGKQISTVMNPLNFKNAPTYIPAKGITCKYFDADDNEYFPNEKNTPVYIECTPDNTIFKNYGYNGNYNINMVRQDNKATIYNVWIKNK